MDGLPWNQLGIGSGWLIVCLFVIAILRGSLVPRRNLDDEHHEKNEWKTESRIKDQQIAELLVQVGHMREVGKTVDAIMRSIQRNAHSGDRTSSEDSP